MDPITGNFQTLKSLGYMAAGGPVLLSMLDADMVALLEREMIGKKKYIAFSEAALNGYIWYNSFLERWYCEVYKDSAFSDTFLSASLENLVMSVRAVYCTPQPLG